MDIDASGANYSQLNRSLETLVSAGLVGRVEHHNHIKGRGGRYYTYHPDPTIDTCQYCGEALMESSVAISCTGCGRVDNALTLVVYTLQEDFNAVRMVPATVDESAFTGGRPASSRV